MKKVWAVMFVIGVVIISLCGCGSESEVDDEESAKIQEEQSKEADTRYQREKRYHEDGREILVYTVFEYGPMQKSLVLIILWTGRVASVILNRSSLKMFLGLLKICRMSIFLMENR